MLAGNLLVIALLAYLAGSIPTSIWISKAFFGFDIRKRGSGNAGATNAWRVLGWQAALGVVATDIGKGFVATAWLSQIRFYEVVIDTAQASLLAGIAAILGHVWTIFARFRGGKGVATMGGMLMALYPTILPFCLLVFFLVVLITRYVSLGSLMAAACLPIGLGVSHWGFGKTVPPLLMSFAFAMVFLIAYTHRTNIRRLISGTENKIAAPKSAKSH